MNALEKEINKIKLKHRLEMQPFFDKVLKYLFRLMLLSKDLLSLKMKILKESMIFLLNMKNLKLKIIIQVENLMVFG
jgi:hypothetical protein